MTESDRVYLSPPHMGQESLDFVREAFESNWIAPLGPQVDSFEREFSSVVDVASVTALSTGTAALHLSLVLQGVKAGDEVLCSTLTFAASAFAITYVGGTPVFIDSNAHDWNMDPVLLEELLSQKAKAGRLPRAAIVVDLYGQPANYDQILPICADFDVPVIEDAAEALGAEYRGRPVGGFGSCGVFSFNGNKIITTSGGGMLVSSDPDLTERARFLATQARDPAPHYQHSEIGYNYRMSNILAAIGRGQLHSLPDRVAARRRVFGEYVKRLGHLPGIEFMPEPEYSRSTRWLTCLTIDPAAFGANR
ncbi:MAG: DegT/DnrJ/EryC1/StrS family aminotransferase, partial [Rhodothermia bacterium]|nr:DegT/DnrJ/EryC1/StrS family aminotransferase [Rhodothermia bacterium]